MSVRFLVVTSLALATVLALPLAAPEAALAQQHPFFVGALGGIGGATEEDPFEDPAVQLLFGYERGVRDFVVVRAGRLDLDSGDGVLDFQGDLEWLTVVSEYRLPEGFYISGLFLGLGYYQRGGNFGFEDDEAWGVTLGIDGEFPITERWSVLVELSGHWADLEGEQVFTMALGGVTFSF